MNRAARRRVMRSAGLHRSAGKKGRRAPVRMSTPNAEAITKAEAIIAQHLAEAGFVIARPKLHLPGGK